MYNIGDKIRIKQWEDMEKEFGLDKFGDIKTFPRFSKREYSDCGKIFTVASRFKSIKGNMVYLVEENIRGYPEAAIEGVIK